ncbi:MAG: hypothetical protein ACI9R3_003824 [Verrucomicrobiales bacterium]|jgi:hypothetical protein
MLGACAVINTFRDLPPNATKHDDMLGQSEDACYPEYYNSLVIVPQLWCHLESTGVVEIPVLVRLEP